MKVWNNELGYKTDWKEGHCWIDIMDNVNEGDIVINGRGQILICTMKLDLDKYNDFGEKKLMVWLHPTKKDGTLHKGRSAIRYRSVGEFTWEREE
tara:strand:+ start:261 stop:545 length:285 start_codon:yes stop_codon:yes gene_type:complete